MKKAKKGYKAVSCLTQLSMKFIILINVKVSTIVGILTFIIVFPVKRNSRGEHPAALKLFPPALKPPLPPPALIFI